MSTLEKIRAEIEEKQKNTIDWSRSIGLIDALEIIDKYAEQEPCDKCAMKNSNSNYCKNCMVAEYNGKKVSVPTKFVEQEPASQCDLCKFNTKLMLIEANVSGYAQGLKESSKAEQNPSRDIKEIAEVIKSDVDAETKCKMISNILTAKPHYFEEQPRESEDKE